MNAIRWDIRRAGRAWAGTEFHDRAKRRPEKLEIVEGKLLLTEEDRINLLGLLLENVGADRTVRLGDPQTWIDAAESLKPAWARRSFLGDPFNRWMLILWCVNLVFITGVVLIALRRPELPPASRRGVAAGMRAGGPLDISCGQRVPQAVTVLQLAGREVVCRFVCSPLHTVESVQWPPI